LGIISEIAIMQEKTAVNGVRIKRFLFVRCTPENTKDRKKPNMDMDAA
jgi:hypothetical protein